MGCSATKQVLVPEKTSEKIDSLRQELILVNQKLERKKDLVENLEKEKSVFIQRINELKNKLEEEKGSINFKKTEREKREKALQSRIKTLGEKISILRKEIYSQESWGTDMLRKKYSLMTKNNQLEKEKREAEDLYQETRLAKKTSETIFILVSGVLIGLVIILLVLIILSRKKR